MATPAPVTVEGLTVALMLGPKTDASRSTGSVNPLSEVTVMVDVEFVVPVDGAVTVAELGLAAREKSGPETSTVRKAERGGRTPVALTP